MPADSAPPSPTPRRSPAEIQERLARGGRAAVALSGGVDSAVVAYLAHRSLGELATAVTLFGPAVSAAEVAQAEATAQKIGIAHARIAVDPLLDPSYQANPTNRCYFCRRGEARRIRDWGAPAGVSQYLDGIHQDDLGDDRPGLRAMDEAGFTHPLAEAGWRKADVRSFARAVGLPNWDRPSDACLASRVAHGQPITLRLLDRVQTAEAWLREQGFRRVRVRTDGTRARIEVDPQEVARLLSEPLAVLTRSRLTALGFQEVELDPNGYRPRAGA